MDDLKPRDRGLTRRELIKTAAAAGVIASVGPLVRRAAAQSRKPPHVVIVGAGLAGLCAAYELQKHGCTYTILEAERDHIGGRVRTKRYSDGTYGELGAMRIPGEHKITMSYVHAFGLPHRPFVNSHDEAFFVARGQKVKVGAHKRLKPGESDSLKSAYQLRPWERDRSPDDLWAHAVLSQLESLTDEQKKDLAESNILKTKKVDDLDRLSLRRLVEFSGLSEEAVEYLFVTWAVASLQHSAATEHLREELSGIWSRPDFFEIVGGMDLLPKAFADRLDRKPRRGCEVVDLQQDQATGRVTALYRDRTNSGKDGREEGDFLICTIPFPVLARLEARRRFTPEKQRAIRDLYYESATKVLVPTKTRFWETKEKIFGGASHTDLMTGSIYYPSDNPDKKEEKSKGPGVLVASYCWGQEARRLGTMERSAREDFTIALLRNNVHPELTPDIVRRSEVESVFWDSHPWAGGAFAFYMPGQFANMHRHVVAPEGRIYFAGEHCSRTHTWMQGALESAQETVTAIRARAEQEAGKP